MRLEIRIEEEGDYRAVEELTREAFWDVHVPGCCEHYLIHTLRNCPDFISELDFVAVSGGRIAGHIAYVKARIEDASGLSAFCPPCRNRESGAPLSTIL